MSELTGKQRAFVDQYLLCDFNGTEAASRAGYAGDRHALSVVAAENLVNPRVLAAIKARLAHRSMTAEEVIVRLTDHGRGSLDDVITFHTVRSRPMVMQPLGVIIQELRAQISFEEAFVARAEEAGIEPDAHTSQIVALRRRNLRLEMRLERDPDATEEVPGPVVETQVPTVDLAKAASRGKLHLVKSFNGKDEKAELYDAQSALVQLGKLHGMFKDVVKYELDWDSMTPEQLQRIRDGEDPAKVLKS